MNMRNYISAHCEAQRRDPEAYARHYDPRYDDDYDTRTGYSRVDTSASRPTVSQATPYWLSRGLQQYLELIDEDGQIAPRDRDERYGHLAASVQDGEQPSFFEVTSDALYLPQGVKIGRKAVGEHCLVAQTSFSLGVRSGETPEVKPRLTLDVLEIEGESRSDIIRAAKAKNERTVQLREDDLDPVDDSGNLSSRLLVRTKSDIRKPKTNPRISNPITRELISDSWEIPPHPGEAAGGLLKAVLSPAVDERMMQVRVDAPTG